MTADASSHWHSGFNLPGYLPQRPPDVHGTFDEARDALSEDMDFHANSEVAWAGDHNSCEPPCPAFGSSCGWQRAADIRAARADLATAIGPEWARQAAGLAYWVTTTCADSCLRDQPPT